jgi:hypothetical protein
MAQRDFNIAVLKAQGVTPSLAAHLVGLVEGLEAANVKARRAITDAKRRAFKAGWNARAKAETR